MLKALQDVARESYDDNPILGQRKLLDARARLKTLDDGATSNELLKLHQELGMLELIQGNNEEAVTHLQTAWDLVREMPADKRPRGSERLTYNLAVACMRLGETRNCVAHHTSQSCILPIGPAGVHVDKEGSTRAVRYFQEVLGETPVQSDTHLAARWLLNIAYMTLGEYPDGVPAEQRIPPSTFASDAPFPHFEDVAPRLGLNLFSPSGGVAIEDFDLDGLLDLFVTTWDTKGQALYYHHEADGSFSDRTEESGVLGILGGLNLGQADYDTDGDVDLLILRGGWQLGRFGQHPKSLLQNQGPEEAGHFLDVTYLAGLGEVNYPTQTADWADYDLDGDLDLYVGNESTHSDRFPSQLFQNQGDGTFKDVGAAAGVQNVRMAKGVTFGDIDGDRYPDLYVSNYMDPNRLYLNRGDGTFVDVAVERGVDRPQQSFPAWFWDFDNDGALDLYVSSYYQSSEDARLGPVVASYLGLPVTQDLNKLYKGDGSGHFRDVAKEQGLDLFTVIMGASFGDLDNDGFPDMYLGTGYPFYDGLVPNVMYWNRGGKSFADITTAGGFGHLQKGHGVSFADLDEDGDQDVYENMGGAYPGDAFGDVLFENPGLANHWLKVRLVGTRSNRSGIGARIRAQITEDGRKRSVYQTVGQHGSFGNSPFEMHLGLGRAQTIDVLEVFWPMTSTTQVFRDLPVDRRVRITEGAKELEVRATHPLPFKK